MLNELCVPDFDAVVNNNRFGSVLKRSFLHIDCIEFQIARSCRRKSRNRLNGCQIFEWFGVLKTKSELIFSFSHTPGGQVDLGQVRPGHLSRATCSDFH